MALEGSQLLPGANTSAGVALAGQSGGPLFKTWKGIEGDERIWWSRFSGTTWDRPPSVPGAGTGFRPALAILGV